MNIALVVIIGLGAILLFLLATASANTTWLAQGYSYIVALNLLTALALLGLVIKRLVDFWYEYRARVFGSRLKWRLIVMLSIMAGLPGALVYLVSVQFATTSIDSWFDVRMDRALESGMNLGRSIMDRMQSEALVKAQHAAAAAGPKPSARSLEQIATNFGASEIAVLDNIGKFVVRRTEDPKNWEPYTLSVLDAALEKNGFVSTKSGSGNIEGPIAIQALVPLPMIASQPNAARHILALEFPVADSTAQSMSSISQALRAYQQLEFSQAGLKRLYTVTLSFTLIIVLFAAIALAFSLAERLVRPLTLLAEGTQAVTAGDFTPRQTVATHDELGLLTRSFSKMIGQLSEAQKETEYHRLQMEASSAYLESVLANLQAGVLAFDGQFHLRAINHGAGLVLADDMADCLGLYILDWPRHHALAKLIHSAFQDNKMGQWECQFDLQIGGGVAPRLLMLRGSVFPQESGSVVVFDDISPLVAAQRIAAWGEVARRLAHEIKNPLTPIRLAAERLNFKLATELTGEARALLERSTIMIVTQVETMESIVNDFRDYARLPRPKCVAVDLNQLVTEMIDLYHAGGYIKTKSIFEMNLPAVYADPNQLRQVLANLFANAREAQIDEGIIEVATFRHNGSGCVRVSDRGCGFTPNILAHAYEPYVTTKSKGTGLGLAIVQKIMEEHGGEIHIANRSGGGAEITISLKFFELEPTLLANLSTVSEEEKQESKGL